MKTISNAGDLGDTLYMLPTIAQLTVAADLVLYPDLIVREKYTPTKVLKINDFLTMQTYVKRVRFETAGQGLITDQWRRRMRRRDNLCDSMALAHNVKVWPKEKPWLTVDEVNPETKGKVVFHRSPRYRNDEFPWQDVVKTMGTDAVFVGAEEEHAEFASRFGMVPFYPTPTLLDLARVIAGCRMFIGNQSAPRAVAEGFKRRVCVEESTWCPNTHFVRPTAYYGRKGWPEAKLVWAASFRFE